MIFTFFPSFSDSGLHLGVGGDKVIVDHNEILELWVGLKIRKKGEKQAIKHLA